MNLMLQGQRDQQGTSNIICTIGPPVEIIKRNCNNNNTVDGRLLEDVRQVGSKRANWISEAMGIKVHPSSCADIGQQL
jgi:hypothetical protein